MPNSLDFTTVLVTIHIVMSAKIHVGTQSWGYPDWLDGFFPIGTREADFLSIYARAFQSVEVDSTFHSVQPESTFRSWVKRTPDDFVFSLKFPQAVTHEGRLRDTAGVTELFFDRVRLLGPKLGPILVQLGPDFRPDEMPALLDFLPRIPRDLRVAIEFRDKGWVNNTVLTLLEEHNIAVALVDGPWIPLRWMLKLAERPTTDFLYVRLMGPDRSITDHSHVQVDRSRDIALWSEQLGNVPDRVTNIYAYVSNYFSGHAPADARELQRQLGLTVVEPAELDEQIGLF